MLKLLNEPFVQKSIVKHLAKQGYTKYLNSRELREHGVDIKVEHKDYGRYYLVECKGDPGPKVKSPGGSRSSTFNSAVGEIISRMRTRRKRGYKYGYKYGVGFPVSFKETVLKKLPYDVCDKLHLYVFFVNSRGEVEEYNYKKLKAIQNKISYE